METQILAHTGVNVTLPAFSVLLSAWINVDIYSHSSSLSQSVAVIMLRAFYTSPQRNSRERSVNSTSRNWIWRCSVETWCNSALKLLGKKRWWEGDGRLLWNATCDGLESGGSQTVVCVPLVVLWLLQVVLRVFTITPKWNPLLSSDPPTENHYFSN